MPPTHSPAQRASGVTSAVEHLDLQDLDAQHIDVPCLGEAGPDRVRQLEAQVAHLQEAMLTQRQIGAVIGMVAQRFGCTTQQAWRLLVRLSQNTNIKVRVVARVLCDAFDGRSRPEDAQLLTRLAPHLPASGWPGVGQRGGH